MKKALSNGRYYKYGDLIACLIVVCGVTGVVLTYRLVQLGPFILPGGVFSIAISFAAIDVAAEVYGYAYCHRLIWIVVGSEVLSIIIISATLHLPYPSGWHGEQNFQKVLGLSYRPVIANTISSISGYFANAYIMTKWKIAAKGRFFWLRSVLSSAIAEALYNIIWVFIALSWVIGFKKLPHIMVSMWIYKVIFTGLVSILGIFAVNWLAASEKIDSLSL